MQIYTWDRAGYESAYWKQYYKQRGCGEARAHNCRCSEVDITYSRKFFEVDGLFDLRAKNIVDKLSLTESTDILVIGCGLGFLMESFKELGMNVWGCDNSSYVQTVKNKEKVQIPVHNISVIDTDFINKIRNTTGAMWFDVIVTEDVLPSHNSYAEIMTNCEAMLNPANPKSSIVHIVDTNAAAGFVRKSLAEWTAVAPTHTWLDINGESA